ncbi:MAG TPA: AI-2E family transporter [Methylococcaceae bacterium]|nr:AI-2E family transporter [Methylococcaceae bacterium]
MTLRVLPSLSRHYIPALGFLLLAWLSFCVLAHFMTTLLWAFIIAYVMYPLYEKLRGFFHGNAPLSAALLTGALAVIVLLIGYGLLRVLEEELSNTYTQLLRTLGTHSFQLPARIRQIPHLGEYLDNRLHALLNNRTALNEHLVAWAKYSLAFLGNGLREAGQLTIEFCFVLITVFFCFRDGEKWLTSLQIAMRYFFDDVQDVYLQTLGHTTRAVCYGLVLAALGQGVIAGIGYAVAGVGAPILLGAFTALMALIPMGATLVWIPTGLLLLAHENIWAGLGLLVWGFLVVSTVDNVIRPLVICGASRVPFLVVLFGVFGGLTAFGAIGLFLGPMVLALLLAVWQENLKKLTAQRLL